MKPPRSAQRLTNLPSVSLGYQSHLMSRRYEVSATSRRGRQLQRGPANSAHRSFVQHNRLTVALRLILSLRFGPFRRSTFPAFKSCFPLRPGRCKGERRVGRRADRQCQRGTEICFRHRFSFDKRFDRHRVNANPSASHETEPSLFRTIRNADVQRFSLQQTVPLRSLRGFLQRQAGGWQPAPRG